MQEQNSRHRKVETVLFVSSSCMRTCDRHSTIAMRILEKSRSVTLCHPSSPFLFDCGAERDGLTYEALQAILESDGEVWWKREQEGAKGEVLYTAPALGYEVFLEVQE
jgi:hypothetical protein